MVKVPSNGHLAREFYETYCAHADWKNYQGKPCPQWDELPEAIRGHWLAVAECAIAKLPVAFMATRGETVFVDPPKR